MKEPLRSHGGYTEQTVPAGTAEDVKRAFKIAGEYQPALALKFLMKPLSIK